jgi:hypothetical protein
MASEVSVMRLSLVLPTDVLERLDVASGGCGYEPEDIASALLCRVVRSLDPSDVAKAMGRAPVAAAAAPLRPVAGRAVRR